MSKPKSMFKFLNPLQYMIDAFEDLYPDILKKEVVVQFHPKLPDGIYGEAVFDDYNKPMIINIDYNINTENATEILAHELAHIVYPDDDHGEKWEEAFNKIFERAVEIQQEIYAEDDEKVVIDFSNDTLGEIVKSYSGEDNDNYDTKEAQE